MAQTAGRLVGLLEIDQATYLKDNRLILRLLITTGASLVIVFWAIVLTMQLAGRMNLLSTALTSLLAVAALGSFSSALLLLRRGRTLFGSRVLFYGMVLCCALGVYLLGGPSGPLVLAFFIPVVSAGLLGSGRDSLAVAALSVACFFALVVGEQFWGYTPPVASSLWINVIAFTFSSVFLAVLAWLSGRDLSRALTQSQERADELLHKTEQLIERNFQQIELGSDLATAAAEMQVTSQQQASGATEQASAVSQVSSTIEELGSTARQIAIAAEHVSEAAQQTLENMSSGQDAVDESIQAMERIRGRVSDVSTRVLSLGERSQQIGEIIDLIDDISDETHLLALNAAIEAAGAGEHGRRFAVVAAEVKSLANRTLAAAKEVKGVIAEVRQATSAAVLAAEEGSKEVERGVELAHRAGQVMDNIVMVAERTAQAAAEIGLATAQQQSASEQVVETMREIAEVARQSAQGARQMADSAAKLTAIADRLHGIVVIDE